MTPSMWTMETSLGLVEAHLLATGYITIADYLEEPARGWLQLLEMAQRGMHRRA